MKTLQLIFVVLFFNVLTVPCISQINLRPVLSFGSNLGNLKMFTHIPEGLSGDVPLVVALHGCRQTANSFAKESGWNKLADLHKFIVMYPQQDSINNSYSCFSWFNSSFLINNQLEVFTIKEMVDNMIANHPIDASRIYVTGLSAGAGMTSTLMANYPDVFEKGAMMSGIPYRSSSDSISPFIVMDGIVSKTAGDWGDLVRSARPGYTGEYPDAAIFHGDADTVVDIQNAYELIKQWTAVNNADEIADSIDLAFQGDSAVNLSLFNDSLNNNPVVYFYNIKGMHHAISLDTGACPQQGGEVAKYAHQTKFHSTYWAAKFFDLIKTPYSILGPITTSKFSKGVIFSVSNDTVSSYNWTVPFGSLIIAGQGTHRIIVNLGAVGGEVTVKKTDGCNNEIATIDISLLDFNFSVAELSSIKCHGDSTAELLVSTAGENAPYFYSWMPGGKTGASLTGLKAGTYTLTISDKDSYVINKSTYTIKEPAELNTERFDTICAGENLVVGSTIYDSSGTYTNTFTSFNGCDSLLTTYLTVLPSQEFTQEFTICWGDSILVGSSSYKISGNYQDAFISSSGCDSLVFTQLTVLPLDTLTQRIDICAGEPLHIGANNYFESGSYKDTLISSMGCDSIIFTELNVLPSKIIEQSFTLCSGDSLEVGGSIYKESGTYSNGFSSSSSCDSTIITEITVLPANSTELTITLCFGDSLMIGNNTYKESGSYVDVFTSFSGCDSIINTNLNVLEEIKITQQIILCEGDSVMIGSSLYKNPGIYIDRLTSYFGCDSSILTEIIVLPGNQVNQYLTLCSGDSIMVGNSIYKNEGVYVDVLSSWQGCDSTVNTQVEIMPAGKTIEQSFEICAGDSVNVGSSVYKNSGTYTAIFSSLMGCDSTVITNLSVLPTKSKHQTISLCTGESFAVGNTVYNKAGNYIDVFTSVYGCDSMVYTDLIIQPAIDISVNVSQELGNSLIASAKNASFQWLNCDKQLESIDGAIDSVFVINNSGSYAVSITKNTCIDTSACYSSIVSGMEEQNLSNGIYVSPNPFSDYSTIYFSEQQVNSKILIRNLLGEEMRSIIFSGKELMIEKGELNNGVYFVQWPDAKTQMNFVKIVIQ